MHGDDCRMGVWPTNDLLVSIPIIYWLRPIHNNSSATSAKKKKCENVNASAATGAAVVIDPLKHLGEWRCHSLHFSTLRALVKQRITQNRDYRLK